MVKLGPEHFMLRPQATKAGNLAGDPWPRCPACGFVIRTYRKIPCPECGFNLWQDFKVYCKKCGARIKGQDTTRCDSCGYEELPPAPPYARRLNAGKVNARRVA